MQKEEHEETFEEQFNSKLALLDSKLLSDIEDIVRKDSAIRVQAYDDFLMYCDEDEMRLLYIETMEAVLDLESKDMPPVLSSGCIRMSTCLT